MSYYINLQNAIDFIEENLNENIDLEQISEKSGYSIPHFYRVFGAIVGYSVMEYVRKRRISNAMVDVVITKRSITQIAFEYGFDSHEAFTRAFKLAFGAPPTYFRKCEKETVLFEKVNLLSKISNKGVINMKPQVICKESKLLLGIARKINQSENIQSNLLEKVSCEFMDRVGVITNRVNPSLYYAVYDYNPEDISRDDDQINYTYYYCVEVSDYSSIPEGMVQKIIPQGKYALFTYDILNKTLNGEKINQSIYDYIDGVWLPDSGFELAETSDYEVMNGEDHTMEIYISIK